MNQYHRARTINHGEVTESEYDDLAWEKHEFYWSTDDDGVYNQLRLYITATNLNPRDAAEITFGYTIR